MAIQQFQGFIPEIDSSVYIAQSAEIIGQVVLQENVSIWPLAILRGDMNTIFVGKNSNIQDGCIVHVSPADSNTKGYSVQIGENVTVGHGAVLHGCTIANNCLIGIKSIVMDGAQIQANTVIGAGSLVPAEMILESGFVWSGNPVKKVRALSEIEHNLLLESANHYVQLKNKYLSN